ncbi:MAG: SEC-C domain-containing protein [Pseudomonadota bacterium]
MPKRPMWKPTWSGLCPCASGKKFGDCCWRRLPGFRIGKSYTQALLNKRAERALLATRADITQYTIWHKSNTVPVIASGGAALELLRIDVNALGAYVDRLSSLYFQLGLWKGWPTVLERLRENIQHPWWYKKIAYHRALYHLAPDGDRTEARRELAKAGPITKDEVDLDLLHLYADLELDDQPFADRITILDRILALSEERQNQLQYRGAKAVQYLLIGDEKTAELQLSDAVVMVRDTEKDDPLEGYESYLFGRLLQLLGVLRRDKNTLKESAAHFHTLLLEDYWTEHGKAAIHRSLGESQRHAGKWELAERAYREASALKGSELDKVHIAECQLYNKQIETAVNQIDSVQRDVLARWEFEDFVFAYAAIAIWSGKMERLTKAKSLLQCLATVDPLFRERRLNLLVRVTETLSSGEVSTEAKSDSTPEGGIATVSNFFLLAPNIAGIGVNFNAIIDYFVRRKSKDRK